MAAIKKSKKPGKPGAGLAITLVFFILLSILLGVWGYYGYEGQEKLREAAKSAGTSEAARKVGEKYYQFLALDFALALGYDLDPAKKKEYPDSRKAFMDYHGSPDGGGEFRVLGKSADPDKLLDKRIVDENAKDLGFNDKDLTYALNYRDKVKTYLTRTEDVEKVADARQDSFVKANARFDELKNNYDKWWNKVFTEIKEGNDNVIAAAKATYKQMETALADARRLNEQLLVLQESKEKEELKLNKKIKQLDDQLKTALADRPEGGGAGGGSGTKDIHALVLDISGFRPLWDRPLGEITALDLSNRLIYVRPNRNVNQAFKPGTSFLIFARGADGGASGVLKGSAEIVREAGENSFACRITSFYDVDRGEVQIADPAKLLGIRLSKNALREGDLIFNMFYGTHVALGGVFDLDGDPAAAPAELSRQMDATIASLKRRGIEVDAYIDPITGQVKGAITQKTRFLIQGNELAIAAMAGPKLPPMKPKMEGEEGKEDMPAADRATALEESLRRMRQQAVDNGLFLISLPNFVTVIGYVPPVHFGETTRVMPIPHLPAATTLALAGIGFVSKTDVRLADFAGEWEGNGWELSLTDEGKAKVNLVIDRGGIPEVRLTPGELSLRAGKYVLNVFGPSPVEMEASVSVGGANLQLEDPTGKLAPPRVVLRKR